MGNFIDKITRKRTPEWWDGWCWFGLAMLWWSIGWAVFGGTAWTRGLQTGLAIYWVGYLVNLAGSWYQRDLTDLYRESNNYKDQIILSQRREIRALNEEPSK